METGKEYDVRKLSMLQLRTLVDHLHITDSAALKKVVALVLDELGESRAELARQDDTLNTLVASLAAARDEALALQDLVGRGLLGHTACKLSPLAPETLDSPARYSSGYAPPDLQQPAYAVSVSGQAPSVLQDGLV
ncbi:hypothetical protein DIPPA_25399 [Diplonema papillatum]|nr:hypothetical protein DIPPA_25399 [Diplonema papillatum]